MSDDGVPILLPPALALALGKAGLLLQVLVVWQPDLAKQMREDMERGARRTLNIVAKTKD
jgi:hypothetical protein